MNGRCCIGDLRSLLDNVLKDDGYQGDKDGLLHAALSRVRRSLNSSSLFMRNHKKLQMEVQDCAASADVENICLKDLEGLASNLVALLASGNSFTKHSAGSAFVALFSYLHRSASLRAFIVGFLWSTLKGCFCDEDGYKFSKEGVSFSCLETKPGCSTFGVRIAMHLFQIFHDILRKLKLEKASDFEAFLDCSAAHISEILLTFSTYFKCRMNNAVKSKPEEDDDLMFAAFLRFLCSFIHSVCVHPNAINITRNFLDSQIMSSLIDFLEAISQHCLRLHQNGHISHYLRHKVLMLMFRLHDWFIEWPSLALTCLEILRLNMSTLCPSLFVEQTLSSAPLLLSPFAACLAQSKSQFLPFSSACQPEKHAVYLIFKLELSLMKVPSGSSERKGNVLSPGEQGWMFKWLLLQISLPGHLLRSGTAKKADLLSSSFLQIFIDEDTSVLKVLLLLQDYSISDLFPRTSDHDSSQIAQKLLVEVFNPIRLFAVFLSLISYDHSVVIDFLIAKDTSILCLQYLLRSMRLVRNTWPELLSLSDTSTSKLTGTDALHQVSNEDAKQSHSSASYIYEPLAHDNVIDINRVGICLLKVRSAIEKLHEKHSFPYNPSPLLKHMDFFELLWLGKSS